jgi:hypothetical protein
VALHLLNASSVLKFSRERRSREFSRERAFSRSLLGRGGGALRTFSLPVVVLSFSFFFLVLFVYVG